jgi:hypothetical protein
MLGIKVRQDHWVQTILLLQQSYIESILRHFGLETLKPLFTPFDMQVQLTSEQVPANAAKFAVMHDVPYHEAVGVLNWAMLVTHPNIAFAVLTVARFSANPGPAH